MKSAKEWDNYWKESNSKRFIYNFIASFYRRVIIRPYLNFFIKKHFIPGVNLLHAGCGGGEVDKDIIKYASIVPLDFSKMALVVYKRINNSQETVLADISKLPKNIKKFDGIYNLGVMEHFTEDEIDRILNQFYLSLKPKGKIILFWPPEFGLSVYFFKLLVFISKNVLRIKNVKFHPDEVSRIPSRDWVYKVIERNHFKIIDYSFGIRDLFTYCVVVARKIT